ncbi:MAG: hypothetical protein KGI37_03290 [Alphaproteobacteria bacterium]|nr:hypothetical protein [Alphaproteobacteria bacterium]
MQIPSIPPPILTAPLPQDIAAKAVATPQAVAPLVQNAVDPAPKSEKSYQNRDHKDQTPDKHTAQDKNGEKDDGDANDGEERGTTVNISV